jgi:hypothetical protein
MKTADSRSATAGRRGERCDLPAWTGSTSVNTVVPILWEELRIKADISTGVSATRVDGIVRDRKVPQSKSSDRVVPRTSPLESQKFALVRFCSSVETKRSNGERSDWRTCAANRPIPIWPANNTSDATPGTVPCCPQDAPTIDRKTFVLLGVTH